MATTTSATNTAKPPVGARSPEGNQFVFTYGNLYQGLPYGPRNAMLSGFERWHKGYASLKEGKPDDLIYGRIAEVPDDTLARMDTHGERLGDFHRFLAYVTLLPSGKVFKDVWVFQMVEHATPKTLATSINGGLRSEPCTHS